MLTQHSNYQCDFDINFPTKRQIKMTLSTKLLNLNKQPFVLRNITTNN